MTNTLEQPKKPGEQDMSFGANGEVLFDKGLHIDAFSVDPVTKKITAAFNLGSEGFQLFRLNTDGKFDTEFGTAGLTIGKFGTGSGSNRPTGLSVLDDGRILVTGMFTDSSMSIEQPAVAAFHANGDADTEFGDAGSLVVVLPNASAPSSGESADASASAAQWSDNGYLFSFNGNGFYNDKSVLLRVTPQGALDTSFNEVGYRVFQEGVKQTRINALLVQPSGHIVAAGLIEPDAILARFTSSGVLDNTFAENGVRRIALRDYASLSGLTSRADGGLVAVGFSGISYEYGLVVATSENGAVDASFNAGEPLELRVGSYKTSFRAVAVNLDNLVVIAGNAQQQFAAVFRLLPDGKPDTSFAPQGYISALGFRMTTMILQPDNNILLGGALVSRPVLRRYLGSDPVTKTASRE